jgi:hypothetical protein
MVEKLSFFVKTRGMFPSSLQCWSLQRNDEDMDKEPRHRQGDEDYHQEGTPTAGMLHQA